MPTYLGEYQGSSHKVILRMRGQIIYINVENMIILLGTGKTSRLSGQVFLLKWASESCIIGIKFLIGLVACTPHFWVIDSN